MKKIIQQLFVCWLLVAAIACRDIEKTNTEDTKKTAEEQNEKKFPADTLQVNAQFLVDATAGNIAEIKLAQLALERSGSKEIKEIAKMLVDDHTAALNDLKMLASNKSVSIPAEETDAMKADLKDLSDDPPKEFDAKWCSELMKKHEKTINDYEMGLGTLSDNDIKNWINTVLPKIRTHYDKLMACNSRIPKK